MKTNDLDKKKWYRSGLTWAKIFLAMSIMSLLNTIKDGGQGVFESSYIVIIVLVSIIIYTLAKRRVDEKRKSVVLNIFEGLLAVYLGFLLLSFIQRGLFGTGVNYDPIAFTVAPVWGMSAYIKKAWFSDLKLRSWHGLLFILAIIVFVIGGSIVSVMVAQ